MGEVISSRALHCFGSSPERLPKPKPRFQRDRRISAVFWWIDYAGADAERALSMLGFEEQYFPQFQIFRGEFIR